MNDTATRAAVAELLAELAHADELVADQQVRIEELEAEVAQLRAALRLLGVGRGSGPRGLSSATPPAACPAWTSLSRASTCAPTADVVAAAPPRRQEAGSWPSAR